MQDNLPLELGGVVLVDKCRVVAWKAGIGIQQSGRVFEEFFFGRGEVAVHIDRVAGSIQAVLNDHVLDEIVKEICRVVAHGVELDAEPSER